MDPAVAPEFDVAPTQRKEHGAASEVSPKEAHTNGKELPSAVQAQMESTFGADFSAVRVHEGPQAASMGALAYTQGTDIYFQPGQYAPHNQRGLELLGHELAHVVQQSQGRVQATTQLKGVPLNASPALEREADEMAAKAACAPTLEAGDTEPAGRSKVDAAVSSGSATVMRREVIGEAEITGPGDWTMADRESNTARWKSACLHNLSAGDSAQYVKIAERRDFYRWFYEHTVDLGFHTRWALAASIVANGAQQVADVGAPGELVAVSNELQGFMRLGNQVIFDDVFPKLLRLLKGDKLTQDAALKWDMETLSSEQALVQTLYDDMSPSARTQMEDVAKQRGWVVNTGKFFTSEDTVKPRVGRDGQPGTSDDYNRGGDIPAFPENDDLTSADARWRYGMSLGKTFAPNGTLYDPNVTAASAPHRAAGRSLRQRADAQAILG